MDRKRSNNDSFRPALRFPTDPHNPSVLPSKIQHIVAPGTASASPSSSASNLLQSKRKPWEVDVTRLDDLVAQSSRTGPKVVVVLGDPSAAAVEPIVTSGYLKGSLVIIVASAENGISLSPNTCVPAIRILRLRPASSSSPSKSAQPQQRSRHAPSSHGHHPSPLPPQAPEPTHLHQNLSASRLNTVLDWADRVASQWRQASTPNAQLPFAVLREETQPAPSSSSSSSPGEPWRWNKNKSKPRLTEEEEGRLAPWTTRFALNSRSNGSSLADSESGSSMLLADLPAAGSNSSLHHHLNGGGYASVGRSTAAGAVPGSRAQTQSAPPSSSNGKSGASRRRFSIVSFGGSRQKSAPDVTTLSSSSSSSSYTKPVFDAVINFLPPSSSTGAEGSLGRGAIASTHALAAHSRLLLRQTILVTTATQRFLVPVPPRTSSSSTMPSEGTRGRFGSMQAGGRPLAPKVGNPNMKSKRWSLALVGSWFGGEPPVSAKAAGKRAALPTPPMSRPSSSDEPNGGGHQRRPSVGLSRPSMASSSRANQWTMPPKLIHVLPFSSGGNNNANARLVRSVEAFLLSWSFGGGRDGGVGGGDIPEESVSPSLSPVIGTSGSGKRTIRPFLLDVAGLADVLRAKDPFDSMISREWSLADLILSGAMDDEYPCSGHFFSGSPGSGLSTPEVIVTRASMDQRPSTAPSKFGEGSRSNSFTEYAAAVVEAESSSEAWASRRAWLGCVGDLIIHPSSARPPAPVVPDERARTKSLQAPSPVIRQPVAPPLRAVVHARSMSESSGIIPPPPPAQQQQQNRPPPMPQWSAPSAFPNRLTKDLPRQPSYSDDGHSTPTKLKKAPSLKRSSPELTRRSSQGAEGLRSPPSVKSWAPSPVFSGSVAYSMSPAPSFGTPIANAFASTNSTPRMPPQNHSPPTAWQQPQPQPMSPPQPLENDAQFGVASPSGSSVNMPWAQQRPPGPQRNDTVGTLTTIDTMRSYSTMGSSFGPGVDPYASVRSTPGPGPYNGMSVPRPLPRPPQLHPEVPVATPSSYTTASASTPSSTAAAEEGYFNGYLVASPSPSAPPPPPRPERMRPPPPSQQARAMTSPLRHGISAPPPPSEPRDRASKQHGGSVRNKQLPITPPDSASSSEVSNESGSSRSVSGGSGSGSGSEKRKWWAAGSAKVTLKSMA